MKRCSLYAKNITAQTTFNNVINNIDKKNNNNNFLNLKV